MTKRHSENDRIARMARTPKERLPFLCECDRATCFELVWLSPGELAAHRAENRPVLAHPVESAHLSAA